MATRFPMVCDSCLHKTPGLPTCTAFPDRIPLDPMEAELHDEPRPDQDNEIVWQQAPGKEDERSDFDGFRAAVTGGSDDGS